MFVIAVVVSLVLAVVLALAGLYAYICFVLGTAVFDLYAALSLEPELFESLLERVLRHKSPHLARFFSSTIFELVAVKTLEREGYVLGDAQESKLLYLLGILEDAELAETVEEDCTLEWLEANRHRVAHLIPSSDLADWERRAREAAEAPQHTEQPDCERCAKEDDLELVFFVRKLPMGRRPPRFLFPPLRLPVHVTA